MTDYVAAGAQRKAIACEEGNKPNEACRWYLTAADAWAEQGELRRAGECLTRAAFNAHVLKHFPQAALIAAEAIDALVDGGAPPCATAPALVARGLAMASMDQAAQAIDAWEAAVAAHLGGFEATRARSLAQLVLSHVLLLDSSTEAAWRLRYQVLDVALRPVSGSPWWEGADVGELVPVLLDTELPVPSRVERQWGPHIHRARASLRRATGSAIYEGLDAQQQGDVNALLSRAADGSWAERLNAWLVTNAAVRFDAMPRGLSAHLACLKLLAG